VNSLTQAEVSMTPRLSVVLPAYNRVQWLGTALDSVLAPGLDCELVVVDNGSSDGTWDLLQDYVRRDSRVRAVRWEENNGGEVYPCLLEMAKGEYVTLFADDDEMLPGGLARKMALLDAHPEVGMVFSPVRTMNSEGVDTGEMTWARIAEEDIIGWDAFDTLILSNCVPMPAAMFRRALMPTGDLLRIERFHPTGDWNFWLDLSRRSQLAYLREPTVRLRIHDHQATVTHGVKAGGFITGTFNILKYWMLEADPPYVPSARAWAIHQLNMTSYLQGTHGQDEAKVQEGMRKFQTLRTDQEALFSRRDGGEAAQPEAFLHEPDWAGSEWVEVLLSYLEAFGVEDPVALVLVMDPAHSGTIPPEKAQEAILQMVASTGREHFPDVILVERPAELLDAVRAYQHLQWVPLGAGRTEGLTGALGRRLAQARRNLASAECR
jgi:hypothetical protein